MKYMLCTTVFDIAIDKSHATTLSSVGATRSANTTPGAWSTNCTLAQMHASPTSKRSMFITRNSRSTWFLTTSGTFNQFCDTGKSTPGPLLFTLTHPLVEHHTHSSSHSSFPNSCLTNRASFGGTHPSSNQLAFLSTFPFSLS